MWEKKFQSTQQHWTVQGEACESSSELPEEDKDGSALLEEILGGLSLHEPAPLCRQWSPVFGDDPGDGNAAAADPRSLFLPSQLLDHNLKTLLGKHKRVGKEFVHWKAINVPIVCLF